MHAGGTGPVLRRHEGSFGGLRGGRSHTNTAQALSHGSNKCSDLHREIMIFPVIYRCKIESLPRKCAAEVRRVSCCPSRTRLHVHVCKVSNPFIYVSAIIVVFLLTFSWHVQADSEASQTGLNTSDAVSDRPSSTLDILRKARIYTLKSLDQAGDELEGEPSVR